MYNPESMERSSKYKKRLKILRSTIESFLNQSHNKYKQDTICIENYEESISYFFTYSLKQLKRVG
jgi:hypothetical protein